MSANKRTIYRITFLLSCNLLCNTLFSQNKETYSLSTFRQWGWVLPTNDFVKGNNTENKPISQVCASSLRFTLHTSGKEYWHQLYNYPSFGLGIFTASFNVPNQLGTPTALYLFFTKPIFSKGKYTIHADYSAGVAFNWLCFSFNHQERTAMGSSVSCYLDVSLLFKRKISRNLDLGIGISLTHFSNGAMRKPNYGINLLSSKISIDYCHNPIKHFKHSPIPNFESHFVDIWTAFVGSHNVFTKFSYAQTKQSFDRRSYYVGGIDRRVLKRFNHKHSLGLGFGLGYDQYIGTTYEIINQKPYFFQVNQTERINFSTYISYEYRIHRLALAIEPGIYLYKNTLDQSPRFFQRIGLRYYLKEQFLMAINLRASYFSVAQYIEWSIGYAFENKQTKYQKTQTPF